NSFLPGYSDRLLAKRIDVKRRAAWYTVGETFSGRGVVSMRCSVCNAELPQDAQFCIECAAPVVQAATGPTRRIGTAATAARCPHCGTANPEQAIFCVTCGQSLSPDASGRPSGSARVEPLPAPLTAPARAPAPVPRRAPAPPPFAHGGIAWAVAMLV